MMMMINDGLVVVVINDYDDNEQHWRKKGMTCLTRPQEKQLKIMENSLLDLKRKHYKKSW